MRTTASSAPANGSAAGARNFFVFSAIRPHLRRDNRLACGKDAASTNRNFWPECLDRYKKSAATPLGCSNHPIWCI
jgi:hypothetical protein